MALANRRQSSTNTKTKGIEAYWNSVQLVISCDALEIGFGVVMDAMTVSMVKVQRLFFESFFGSDALCICTIICHSLFEHCILLLLYMYVCGKHIVLFLVFLQSVLPSFFTVVRQERPLASD